MSSTGWPPCTRKMRAGNRDAAEVLVVGVGELSTSVSPSTGLSIQVCTRRHFVLRVDRADVLVLAGREGHLRAAFAAAWTWRCWPRPPSGSRAASSRSPSPALRPPPAAAAATGACSARRRPAPRDSTPSCRSRTDRALLDRRGPHAARLDRLLARHLHARGRGRVVHGRGVTADVELRPRQCSAPAPGRTDTSVRFPRTRSEFTCAAPSASLRRLKRARLRAARGRCHGDRECEGRNHESAHSNLDGEKWPRESGEYSPGSASPGLALWAADSVTYLSQRSRGVFVRTLVRRGLFCASFAAWISLLPVNWSTDSRARAGRARRAPSTSPVAAHRALRRSLLPHLPHHAAEGAGNGAGGARHARSLARRRRRRGVGEGRAEDARRADAAGRRAASRQGRA